MVGLKGTSGPAGLRQLGAPMSEGSQLAGSPNLQPCGGGLWRLWSVHDPPTVRGHTVVPNATFTAATTVAPGGARNRSGRELGWG